MKREDVKLGKRLSDTALATLEPDPKVSEYKIHDGDHLYFRIQGNGKKSWVLRYKNDNGKWAVLGLGAYPMVSGALARRKAKEFQLKLSNGEKIKTKNEIKAEKKTEHDFLFKTLMDSWLASKQPNWGDATYKKAIKSIEKHIYPHFGQRNYLTIEPNEWLNFFQQLQQNLGILTQVEKLTSYCRSAYNLAKFNQKILFNPLEGMTEFLAKRQKNNMKHVGLEELPQLLKAIRSNPSRPIGIGLELMVLLFPRPSELREALWSDFDLDKVIWVKPADKTKTGVIHGVPLPHQAIKLLKELETYKTASNLLFPSRDSYDKPVSDMTFNTALNRLGYKNRQNPHGFRHIASTALNNQFSDKSQVVEACLGHIKKGVKGVYDKGSHFNERIEMMQWWADQLNND
jgi:integrase